MADIESLGVSTRTAVGKNNAKKLRQSGRVPAVMYGHGQETVVISVSEDELNTALRHGSRVVQMIGDYSDQALISDLQWNVWGTEVLHVDFTRVSADERITVEVPIETRGDAPGSHEGGVLDQVMHSVEVECAAIAVPEKLELNINELKLNESLTIADLDAPEGVKVLADAETPVLHCSPPQEEEEEGEGVSESAEPEVIGRGDADKEEGEGED